MSLGKVIAETKDFVVTIGIGSGLVAPLTERKCYVVRNKRTDVIEAEGNSEALSIQGVNGLQRQLDKALSDPEDKAGQAEQEQMMALLRGVTEGGNEGGTPALN